METIRGRQSLDLNWNEWKERLANYNRVHLDLGTGDGRYVRTLAAGNPDWLVIGVDACRENLRAHSQAKLQNMLFIIAAAQSLPRELNGWVSHLTINFPWGSLLEGLLRGDPALLNGIASACRATASIDLRLNGGALSEAGTTLEAGTEMIHANLLRAGWQIAPPAPMNARELRSFPSTWAKRLAFGRDPRAMALKGWIAAQTQNIEPLAIVQF
ncbi:MAG TPA: class I SAM-dependent methyltransferase [Anaerolineales bacterium]|nr:class I SAM-dependent methyltransferase [Anaerolineales bacterium]